MDLEAKSNMEWLKGPYILTGVHGRENYLHREPGSSKGRGEDLAPVSSGATPMAYRPPTDIPEGPQQPQ